MANNPLNHPAEELIPLREELDHADPVRALAARMLSTWEPLTESRVSKRRVRLALDRRKSRIGAFWLRPLLVFGLLLPAGLAVGAWGTVRLVQAWSAPPQVKDQTMPEPSHQWRGTNAAAPAVSNSPMELLEQTQSQSSVVETSAVAATQLPNQAPTPSANRRNPLPSAASEAALVQAAVQALRINRDPERARSLLGQYQRRNPNGPLLEEASALSIEAAMAQGDPAVRKLATTYLARFPNGRYRARIQSILDRSSN